MRVITIAEIPSSKGVIQKGQIIEISPAVFGRLQGKVETLKDLDALQTMEVEYYQLLKRAFHLDAYSRYTDKEYTEMQNLVVRLDELYRALHREGRKVPVRIPVEKKKAI